MFGSAPLLLALACGEPSDAPQAARSPAQTAAASPRPHAPPPRPPPRERTLHFADEIAALSSRDLAAIERLDLAFSREDLVGQLESARGRPSCEALNLIDLAAQLPALRELRVSGCSRAVAAGLGVFGDRLLQLELADMEIDEVAVGRLAQLTKLQSLALTRTTLASQSLGPLRKLPIARLQLRELERDSNLSNLISLWPKTLESLTLDGEWAGHVTMTYLPAAKGLRELSVLDTRVSNFSLNQLKLLTAVEDVTLSGTAFNDHTPMIFRELPVRRFRCTCPSLGDEGLKNLRRLEKLEVLEMPESRLTDEGLVHLAEFESLRELTLLGVAVTADSLVPLAELDRLTTLRLGGAELESSRLDSLGELVTLQHLSLRFDNLGDDIARALRPLRSLRHLDLAHTEVSDAVVPAISELRDLEFLSLRHTRITRDLEPLAKLKRLRVLELDHTDLVDEGVVGLALLRSLVSLRLDHTLITDAAVDALLPLTALRELNLAGTVISSTAAARLTRLPALEQLVLPQRGH